MKEKEEETVEESVKGTCCYEDISSVYLVGCKTENGVFMLTTNLLSTLPESQH